MPFRERIKTLLSLDKDQDGTLDFIQKWRDVKNKFKSYWSENHWSLRARIKHIASFDNAGGATEPFGQEEDIRFEDEYGNDVPAIQNGVFAQQRYENIREKCLSEHALFVDPIFHSFFRGNTNSVRLNLTC